MTRLVVVAGLVAPLVGLGVTLLITAGGNADAPVRSAADRAAIERVAPGLTSLIAAFRREQTPSDIPVGSANAIDELGDRQPGEDPGLARRLMLPDDQHAYIWPMNDGVCWSAQLAGGCMPTSLLKEQGAVVAFSTSADRPGMWIFARARDDVSTIDFVFDGGQTLTRALANNGLIVQFAEHPIEAQWRKPDGSIGRQTLMRTPSG